MIKKLLKMIEENPDLKVKFMIRGDEVCDDFAYTHQVITSILICRWIEHEWGDSFIFTDYDDFIEHVVDACEEYKTYEQAEKAYPIDSFKKAIVVYLGCE